MTVKATITHDDYLKLRGLAVIAAEHSKALAAITKAAAGITGEEAEVGVSTYYGCTSDEFYSETTPDIDGLLTRLHIEVEEAAPVV